MPSQPFETVVIEARRGRYELRQGQQILLAVPRQVFENYRADCVFPPAWPPLGDGHPIRRLFWNPTDAEFLMTGLDIHPARAVEGAGGARYRAYVQGIWLPQPPLLLLRPFWNPHDPYEPFDEAARRRSFAAQMALVQVLAGLRPPSAWAQVLNATDLYLEALGVSPEASEQGPPQVREGALTPAAPLGNPTTQAALEELALQHVGEIFPLLRSESLAGFHTLTLGAVQTAQALLARHGFDTQEGPYRPH